MGQQVARELRRVAPGAGHPLHPQQHRPRVLGGDRVDRLEQQLGVGGPEHLQHRVELDRAAAEGEELVERAEGVAEAAGSRTGDHRHGAVVDLDRLSAGDPDQHLGDLLERGALEVEALAAVGDRRHHLVRLGGGEDEDRVGRRLLERLEEGVPGLLGQHVRLVEDVDLPAAAGGRVGDALAQIAHVVDRAVGGGVHLDHVDRGAGGDRGARLAFAAGRHRRAAALAVERAGEDLRHRGLAGAARADEQVGVVHLVALDRVAERAHHVLLPDDLVEGARAVAAVEGNGLGHRASVSTAR